MKKGFSHPFITVFWLVVMVSTTLGQLSPGKLSRVHQKLEGIEHCTDCHSRGRQLDPRKCLDCHTLLKSRIESGKGLHANTEYQQCAKCHPDHLGRDFNLIHWEQGKPEIDHKLTGWPLKGAHKALKCRDCHTSKFIPNPTVLKKAGKDLNRTFLGLDTRCLSCHRDEHRGQLSTDCLTCHTMEHWKPASNFDHTRARFRLTGAHRNVSCTKCHPSRKDKPLGKDRFYTQFTGLAFRRCTACHRDVHRGKFGQQCQKCHTTATWQRFNQNAFDHSRTRFPLKGRHQRLKCSTCHKGRGTQKFRGLAFEECRDCHSDYHKGQFSSKLADADCDICHTVAGFRPSKFSLIHHQKTRFPLEGAHGAIPCAECHRKRTIQHRQTIQFKFASLECTTCHTDVHSGETTKIAGAKGCRYCHNLDSWSEIRFNHQQTHFPLKGKHQNVSCTKCHSPKNIQGKTRILFQTASVFCQSCHQEPHHQQFAQNVRVKNRTVKLTPCETCHVPTGWHQLVFDHNRDSRFPLEGAHAEVSCSECHPTVSGQQPFVRYRPLDRRCQACHGKTKENRS